METFDAVVVGAGPAGSTLAHGLAKEGFRVMLAEEHRRVGRPVQCAGLVSKRVLDMAGSDRMVQHAMRGARVWSPSLRQVSFRAGDARAYVISREGLDLYLAERAAKAGATVQAGWRFDGAKPGTPGPTALWTARFTTPEGPETVSAPLLVGADGVASAVARTLRLRRPIEILPAYEAEIPFRAADPDEVEIYLGKSIAPGFFGWSIPDGEGMIRVGVAMKALEGMTARDGYLHLVKRMEKRFGKTLPDPVDLMVSGIPIGTLPATSTGGGLLVGDAAAQVKPLSGGGIFTGMRCSEIAAKVSAQALREKDLSAARLHEYDQSWRAELGAEFDRALYFHRLLARLSDPELDRVIDVLGDIKLRSAIVAFGDIDFPTITARELLSQSPSLLRLFPKALSAFFRSDEGIVPDLDFGPRAGRAHR